MNYLQLQFTWNGLQLMDNTEQKRKQSPLSEALSRKEKMKTEINTPAMLLAIDGEIIYQGNIVSGVKTILEEARNIANDLTSDDILEGKKNTIPLQGEKPDNKKNFSVVIYHVPFKENESSIIKSFDIPESDHNSINHEGVIKKSIDSINKTIKGAEIILCTTEEYGKRFNDKNIRKIYPQADSSKPMYNRVKTYNTLIQYNLLGENVIFMDSDVMILENPWDDLAKLNFDVAVTYRFTPNLVPINEGVIYCRSKNKGSKEFFAKYIRTYEKIKNNKIINDIVGTDLERWRGGQLSLNGICNAGRMITYRDSTEDIVFLPCDKFNRTIYGYSELQSIINENSSFLVHAKGNAKKAERDPGQDLIS